VCSHLFLPRCHRPSQGKNGSASRVFCPTNTTSRRSVFRGCRYSLMSGLQVCSPPRSFLPLRILLQGSRGFYVRAYRALLPPHAPDMLTVRIQVIDGTGLSPCQTLSLVGCSLPSTGITRLQRYYEPLRHPRAPSLSLTGFRLVIADHALGLPVCVRFPCVHAAAIPRVAAGRNLRSTRPAIQTFPDMAVGSAYTSSFSRLAQRSLALRPAHSRCHQFVTR